MFERRGQAENARRDLGHEVLATNDGWASLGAGTTGGSLAPPEQTYVVTSRAELLAALNDGNAVTTSPPTPSSAHKIIYVAGTIDFNVDDAGQPLGCTDYYRNGYSLEAFLAAYDPNVWGLATPSGPLEAARVASMQAQQARVRMRVGSNTTIVGLGGKARLRGVWLDIRGTTALDVTNIIVRDLTFEDTYDCFPAWAPTDGALGSWNALYDAVSLRNADHVWIDHNTFADRETADETQPDYFGVLYQVHDGLVDITNASDLVTVSWNRFEHHDKVMLIGSSDSAAADRGKLRVSLHHNLFGDVVQRGPRVRFGQVHLYNNYYKITNADAYQYSWGVGVESAIYAENNAFRIPAGVSLDRVISRLNGSTIFATGTLVKTDGCGWLDADPIQAWNTVNDPDLSTAVGWTPSLSLGVEPTDLVPRDVGRGAGPFECDH
jgi:pectate lyase